MAQKMKYFDILKHQEKFKLNTLDAMATEESMDTDVIDNVGQSELANVQACFNLVKKVSREVC